MDYIHTRIDNPLELRKMILESAIDSTEIMKSAENILRIDQDSRIFRNELKGFMEKLTKEVDVLLKVLPPMPKEFEVKKEDIKNNNVPRILEQPKFVSYMSERDRLERELENIRKRMGSIQLR